MTTFLQAVNEIQSRLRETQTASVTTSTYSTLLGRYVNDAKRQVEDAWEWDCLSTTLTQATVANTSTYTVTGSGLRQRGVTVNDSTNHVQLQNVPIQWILDQQQLSTVGTGVPSYYAWNGTDGTDSKIELFPTPAGVYSLKINAVIPQATLSSDSTVIRRNTSPHGR